MLRERCKYQQGETRALGLESPIQNNKKTHKDAAQTLTGIRCVVFDSFWF